MIARYPIDHAGHRRDQQPDKGLGALGSARRRSRGSPGLLSASGATKGTAFGIIRLTGSDGVQPKPPSPTSGARAADTRSHNTREAVCYHVLCNAWES